MKKFLCAVFACFLIPSVAHADITIGLVGPLSAKSAIFGEQMKRGAEQAVADINAKGGVLGQKLVLKLADDACDPKQAVAAANQMVSSGIKYVVGHYCSGAAIPASKVYMDENILFVTPAATNPKLTDEGKTVIFRISGRDDRQGLVAGEYLAVHAAGKKVAIIHDNSAFGRGIADVVQATLEKHGQKPVLFEAYTPAERDYAALIAKLGKVGAEYLFIGGYHTEAGLIARQLAERGQHPQILGGDALVTDEFWKISGKAGEGVLMTFGPDPRNRPEAKAAISALRSGGYEPEGYTLYTYAAVETVAEALRRAGNAQDTLKAASNLRKEPVRTVLGDLTFDDKGDIVGTGYVLYRWHDGKYAEEGK